MTMNMNRLRYPEGFGSALAPVEREALQGAFADATTVPPSVSSLPESTDFAPGARDFSGQLVDEDVLKTAALMPQIESVPPPVNENPHDFFDRLDAQSAGQEWTPRRRALKAAELVLGTSEDDAIAAYRVYRKLGIPFNTALNNREVTRRAIEDMDLSGIDKLSGGMLEILADVPTAAVTRNDRSVLQQFGDALLAPSNAARDVMNSKSAAATLGIVARAPFNMAESTYQGTQFAGGVMQQVGMHKWGAEVERFGAYHAEQSRRFLQALEPAGGRLSSGDILEDPTRLLTDEGLAWLIGSTGDTGAKMLPAIGAYLMNPALGAAVSGFSEGGAFYEQLAKDNVPLNSRVLNSIAFGAATSLLDRIGLDAMLPHAPRTAGHVLSRTMQAMGEGMDTIVTVLPSKVQTVVNALRAGAVEGVTEYLENPVQGAIEGFAKNENTGKILARTAEGAGDWSVMLPAGLLAIVTRGIAGGGGAQERQLRAKEGEAIAPSPLSAEKIAIAEQNVTAMRDAIKEVAALELEANTRIATGEQLREAAARGDQSRLKSKDVTTYKDVYRRLVPEGMQSLWFDPETLVTFAQNDVQMSALGVTAEQLATAQESGAPIEVATMDVLSLPEGEERTTLIEAARQSPDGLSEAEAKRFDPAGELDAAVNAIASEQEARQTIQKEERRIQDELKTAGYPEHVAKAYALLNRANAEAFAARYGVDAVRLLQQRVFVRERDGEGDFNQARFRTKADTLADFVQGVKDDFANQKNAFYELGEISNEKFNIVRLRVELGADQVRHSEKRHPGATIWEDLQTVMSSADGVYRGRIDPATDTDGSYIFVKREGDESFVVMGAIAESKKKGVRYVVGTAFRDNAKKVDHWLKTHKAAPYQSDEEITSYPRLDGVPSDLRSGFDQNIDSPEGTVNGPRGSVAFGTTVDGKAQALVKIFAGADLSTVLHESVHIFTRDLENVSTQGGAHALDVFDERVEGIGEVSPELRALLDAARNAEDGLISPDAVSRLVKKAARIRGDARANNDLATEMQARKVNNALSAFARHLGGVEQAREDVRTLRCWAGVPEEGELSDGEIKKLYEAVAAGGEVYFMEGKAPSVKLERIFSGFRSWLVNIYDAAKKVFKTAGFEHMALTDEVRSVFDRMLATNDYLANARKRADLMGGAASVNEAIAETWQESMSVEELRELDTMLGIADRQTTAAMDRATLKDRGARLHTYYEEVKADVEQEPFWQAVDYLAGKKGPGLNKDLLERDYGADSVRELGKARPRLIRKNGGVAIDDVATELGYADGDAFWNELHGRLVVQGQSKARLIESRVQEMLAEDDIGQVQDVDEMAGESYGAYLDAVDKAISKQFAARSAKNPKTLRLLADQYTTPRILIVQRAAEEMHYTRVRDVRPDKFNAALREAQRKLASAVRKGDLAGALRSTDAARLANELYVQSVRARQDVANVELKAQKAARIAPDVINSLAREGLRRVLLRYGLARVPVTPYVSMDSALSLREILAKLNPDINMVMQDDGSQKAQNPMANSVADSFPDWLLAGRDPSPEQPMGTKDFISYRQLTMSQLQDVSNLLAHFEHMGRAMSKANKAAEAARVGALATAGAEAMHTLKARPIYEEGSVRAKGAGLAERLLAEHDNLRAIFMRADGYSNVLPGGKAGVNEEILLQFLLDGENRKKMLWREVSASMAPHVEQMINRIADISMRFGEKLGGLKRADGSPLLVPAKMQDAGRTWTPERVFGMALQMGNASNMDRLKAGFLDLDPETVAALLGDDVAARLFGPQQKGQGKSREGLLNGADWKAVQGIWGTINTLWPDTEKTHREMFGFAPPKIEAQSMRLFRDGEQIFLDGGYFPVKYDPDLSETMAAKQERDDILRSEQARHSVPSAKRGHTNVRADTAPGEAVRLDLGQIMQHLDQAATFITMGPAVRMVDRVTQQPQWRDAYIRVFGAESYKMIRASLQGIVSKEQDQTAMQTIIQGARKLLTYNALSWNMNTVLMQTDALMKSMADQGAAPVMEGLGKLMGGNGAELIRQIESVSPYMESRSRNIDRELSQSVTDIAKMAKVKDSLSITGVLYKVEQFAELGMAPMRAMDKAVSCAIWIGAYNTKMREAGADGKSGIDADNAHHEAAVKYADNTVKRANPDYDATSRTKFIRSPGYNMINMFASATELIFQRQRTMYQALYHGKVSKSAYVRFQTYDMLIPATAFYLFAQAGAALFSSDEEKRKKKKKGMVRGYFEHLLDYAAPSIPIAGPLAASMLIGGQASLGRNVLDRPIRILQKAGSNALGIADEGTRRKKDFAWNLANGMIDLAGFLAKVPTQRARNYKKKVGNALD